MPNEQPMPNYVMRHPQARGKVLWCVMCGEDCAAERLDWGQHCPRCAKWWHDNPPPPEAPLSLAEIEAAIRAAEWRPMTPDEQRIAHLVADWVRICVQEGYHVRSGRIAGTWPSRADVDHSHLLHRLLAGVPILPLGDPRARGLWINGLPEHGPSEWTDPSAPEGE